MVLNKSKQSSWSVKDLQRTVETSGTHFFRFTKTYVLMGAVDHLSTDSWTFQPMASRSWHPL
jgi:hypothetical protein